MLKHVHHPMLRHKHKLRELKGKMKGKGFTPLLLDGGIGGGNSYSSIDDYIATTGRNPMTGQMSRPMRGNGICSGQGLGGRLNSKLEKLMIADKPKQKKIKFNL